MVKHNMLSNINKRLQVVLDDGRDIVGKLLVFDKHMNVVLADAVETRPQTKKMKTEGLQSTRTLGLLLLRGEHVVSVTVLDDATSKDPSAATAPLHAKKVAVKRARD